MLFYLNYLVILVILTLPAFSSVVNIDIQPSGAVTMTGGTFAVLPSAGSLWNTNGPNRQSQDLLLSDGSASGLSLTSDLYEMPLPGNGDALYRDYMIGEARVSGLEAGADYEIVLYSGANLMTVFIVEQSFTRLSPEPDYCPYEHKELPGIDGCDYLRGIVTADQFGEFAASVNLGALAGLQIAIPEPNPEPNPEPCVLTLLPLAATVLLVRRRPR